MSFKSWSFKSWSRRLLGAAHRLLLTGLLLLTGSQVVIADLDVDRNGVVWPYTFEGDVLPDEASPAWAVFDLTGAGEDSSDGDIYSQQTEFHPETDTSDALSFQMNDATQWSNGSTARTVEFRVRIPDDEFESFDGSTTMNLGMNQFAYDLRMWHDKVAFNGREPPNCATGQTVCGGPIGEPEPANVVPIDLTVFHTFRVVVDQNSDPVWKLYIDNNPTPAMEKNGAWFQAFGFDTVVFGDVRIGGGDDPPGGIHGKSEWDFISWTPNGAIPPEGPTSDANGDGKVDGADFVLIQGNDPAGIPAWETDFGAGTEQLSSNTTVPEPSSLWLACCIAICWVATRRSSTIPTGDLSL
ncbi:hypothetical protein OAS39_03300 [Pirellulales bacterium]|nr:hypothetical protein [Pirellulales bacterium]